MKLIKVIAKAHPRRQNRILNIDAEGVYTVSIASQRIEGKANRMLIGVLAEHFKVTASKVKIVTGTSSTHKTVLIG